jgi:hypothetical protein
MLPIGGCPQAGPDHNDTDRPSVAGSSVLRAFFHILPVIPTHGRFSPGLFTAIVLFWPVGIACYWRTTADGALGVGTLIGSLMLGAILMASPIVLLKIKTMPYFRQDR